MEECTKEIRNKPHEKKTIKEEKKNKEKRKSLIVF
jgi:hypothetical protein